MLQNKTAKWYNKKRFLILAFILFPPLGFYGTWKSEKKVLSKIALTLWGIILMPVLLIVTVAIANPSTSNNLGQTDEREVAKSSGLEENTANQSSNSEILSPTEIESLTEFQKKWADSIVKSWEGSFIIDVKLSLPDSIQFYLSRAASNNVSVTRQQNLGVYQMMYDNSKVQLPEKLRNYPVVIDFLPAKGYKIEKWEKFQIMTYQGVKLYYGLANEKKLFGEIIGGYIVDGERYIVVSKPNHETKVFPREAINDGPYYYKANDPNIGTMLNWEIMKSK